MDIVLYSKDNCDFCNRSKILLDMKSKTYSVKMLDVDYTLEQLKELVPTARNFPVIFIDDKYIGGYNELRTSIS